MSNRGATLLAAIALAGCAAGRAAARSVRAPRRGADRSDSVFDRGCRDQVGEAEGSCGCGVSRDVGRDRRGGGYTPFGWRIGGPRAECWPEDIVPGTRDRLAQRVQRENLDNVAVGSVLPDDPKLPANLDRVFLVHMYQMTSPYASVAFARWAEGRREVIVVDADRPDAAARHPAGCSNANLRAVDSIRCVFSRLPEQSISRIRRARPRPLPGRSAPAALNSDPANRFKAAIGGKLAFGAGEMT